MEAGVGTRHERAPHPTSRCSEELGVGWSRDARSRRVVRVCGMVTHRMGTLKRSD